MARILSLGTGSLVSQLPRFLSHDVIGIRRSDVHIPGMEMVQCDLSQNTDQVRAVLESIGEIDVVIFSATPGARLASAYRETYCGIPEKIIAIFKTLGWNPYWIHVSSTGVFHQNSGEWVHENTLPAPTTLIAKLLRQSECIVERGIASGSILRFGGLYGQGRTHLLKSLREGRSIQNSPWSFTNRTHREDAVRAIAFLVERALLQRLIHSPQTVEYFHGVDHDPAPLHEVAAYLAYQHGLPEPDYFAVDAAHEIASQNKRVGNRKLLEAGFQFRYPTYRQGFYV